MYFCSAPKTVLEIVVGKCWTIKTFKICIKIHLSSINLYEKCFKHDDYYQNTSPICITIYHWSSSRKIFVVEQLL
jgi:hypothetical protein